MTDYLLCKTEEIPEGKGRAFQAGQRTIAVVRAKGKFYAMANKCMHRGASMCEGAIADGGTTIRCPWHNWTFDLETGRNVIDPHETLRMFPVRVEDDHIILSA
jgi:nitrite reductase/ring-hydroxylating ferredoxin subunit